MSLMDKATDSAIGLYPFEAEADNLRAWCRFLYRFIGVLLGILMLALSGWQYAQRHLTINIPPDLSTGARFERGHVPAESVFSFSFYIYQQLHRWPVDGSKDYPERITRLSAFFTPGFHTWLLQDAKARSTRIQDRTRFVLPTPGFAYRSDRVKPLGGVSGQEAWEVTLELAENEQVFGEEIKAVVYQYTLRVVAQDADPERNPWGLMIDGYARPPVLIRREK